MIFQQLFISKTTINKNTYVSLLELKPFEYYQFIAFDFFNFKTIFLNFKSTILSEFDFEKVPPCE